MKKDISVLIFKIIHTPQTNLLMKKYLLLWGFVFAWQIQAQTTIKMMNYNLLHFDELTDRKYDLKYILDSYSPDIFTVCELEREEASDTILNVCLNHDGITKYSAATFHYNDSGYYNDLNQMLYYNNEKFELISQSYILTSLRDINHYTLQLRTEDANNAIFLDVYVAHLKSSEGTDNEDERLEMVQKFTDDLQNVPSDHFVIFTGDFNLYTSDEPAYQEIIDPTNAIVFEDPINRPGSWHNNSEFADIFTQSTHSVSDDLFVGGGIDDRFDFIMVSENLMSSTTLHYVSDTYASYGNNGTCFNSAITSTDCSGTTYDETLRTHLYNMSDHLPVVMTMESSANLSAETWYIDSKYFYIAGANPVREFLRIGGAENVFPQVKLYNAVGQKVKEISNYELGTSINLQDLSSGIYFVSLQYNNQIQTLKFVKTD